GRSNSQLVRYPRMRQSTQVQVKGKAFAAVQRSDGSLHNSSHLIVFDPAFTSDRFRGKYIEVGSFNLPGILPLSTDVNCLPSEDGKEPCSVLFLRAVLHPDSSLNERLLDAIFYVLLVQPLSSRDDSRLFAIGGPGDCLPCRRPSITAAQVPSVINRFRTGHIVPGAAAIWFRRRDVDVTGPEQRRSIHASDLDAVVRGRKREDPSPIPIDWCVRAPVQ